MSPENGSSTESSHDESKPQCGCRSSAFPCGSPFSPLSAPNRVDDFSPYEEFVQSRARYPGRQPNLKLLPTSNTHLTTAYPFIGLAAEVGEFLEYIQKGFRRDLAPTILADQRAEMLSEAGDVLWYLTRCVNELGYSLADVARHNMDKLSKRG